MNDLEKALETTNKIHGDTLRTFADIPIVQDDSVPAGTIIAVNDKNEEIGRITNLSENPDEQFNKIVKYLNWLSHEIEDIGKVAARLINERRAKYNFFFEQNKLFLKDYVMPKLKRNKDGEIVGKSYKSVEAGGGVFFRQKPRKVTVNQEMFGPLLELMERYGINSKRIIEKKIVYKVHDEDALLKAVTEIIEKRAAEKFAELKETVEMTEEQANEAMETLIREGEAEMFGLAITVEDAEPFATMRVGTTSGFTGRQIKVEINKAIDGRIIFADEEDEIETLIGELE